MSALALTVARDSACSASFNCMQSCVSFDHSGQRPISTSNTLFKAFGSMQQLQTMEAASRHASGAEGGLMVSRRGRDISTLKQLELCILTVQPVFLTA